MGVHSAIENLDLLKEGQCLEQVSSFLECYLEHPDSRTRLGAARALVAISKRCSVDEWRRLDLSRAREIHMRCDDAGGTDGEELRLLLAAALQRETDTSLSDDGGKGGVTDSCGTVADSRGEVRLQPLCGEVEPQTCAMILKSLVHIGGVVSATFEAGQLVVGTRTSSIAADPAFVADLCMTVEDQMGGGQQIAVLSAVRDIDSESLSPDKRALANLDDSGCSEDEPAYLDDDADEECAESYSFMELGQWSFLKHATFNSQQLQEHEDDPTIVARLRKARQRLERRQNEDRSRISKLLSVITPLRASTSERWHAERSSAPSWQNAPEA